MKKQILSLIFVLSFILVGKLSLVQAHDHHSEEKGFCPLMVVKHAQELGLSEAQQAKIKTIKKDMLKQVKSIAKRSGNKIEKVLTPDQQARYKQMQSSHDHSSCGQKACSCGTCQGEHSQECSVSGK